MPGGRLLSFYSTSDILNFITSPETVGHYRWQIDAVDNIRKQKQDWCKFIFLLNNIPNGEFQKRSESDVINVYTNDENFISSCKIDLAHRIVELYEPTSESLSLLNTEEKVILVNKLPYKKYNFRVIIKPHKLNQQQKEQFIKFLENNPGIGLQENVKKFILTNKQNWDRRYIYVDGEKTLTMLKIAFAEAVSTIHRYVINDK